MTISREPLRHAVRRALFERVIEGELSAGHPISEVELAEKLGVSRTPLREALIALEGEGIVRSRPGKGFSVVPLNEDTANDLYELVGILERASLLTSDPLPSDDLDELLDLNDARRQAVETPERMLEIDREWHRLLLDECRNEQLLRHLRQAKNQLFRYEFAFQEQLTFVRDAIEDHDRIVELLRNGEREKAADHLELHWRRGLEPVPEWFEEAAG